MFASFKKRTDFPTNFFRCPPFTETDTDRRNVSGRTGIIRLAPFTRASIRDIVRFLHRNNEDEEESDSPYPSLKRLAGIIAVFPQLIGKIDGILNKYGKIKIMLLQNCPYPQELANTMGSISARCTAFWCSAQSEGYVDKDVAPTMRDGRPVIPVAPDSNVRLKESSTMNRQAGKPYLSNRRRL